MVMQARSTDAHGLVVVARAAMFFGELREDERRRIALDAAPQVLEA
jgi:hypothetical protein